MATPTRPPRSQTRQVIANPILVGAVILMIAGVGMVLTYNASRGLPFVPSYEVHADVPDAAELVAGGSEVRLRGARIGLVDKVDAEPARGDRHAFARLTLKLDSNTHHLPVDTTVQVRPRSILGAKYVDVRPGRSTRLVPPGGTLPLRNARGAIELSDALKVFGDRTARGLRGTISELGSGFAGRGADLNRVLAAFAAGLPSGERVARALADPSTNLKGFIDAAARVGSALEPVAPQLGGVLRGGARTFGALDAAGSSLGDVARELPPTEARATQTLRDVLPALDDAQAIARDLRPGVRALPAASRRLAAALSTGTRTLDGSAPFADRLGGVFGSLGSLARQDATSSAVRQLIDTVDSVGTTLSVLLPAQLHCNIGGIWAHNLQDTLAGGNSLGNYLNGSLLVSAEQVITGPAGAANLNANPLPHENAQECESGHEPYRKGRFIGNPPGLQGTPVVRTHPPAAATRAARAAGLLDHIPGASR